VKLVNFKGFEGVEFEIKRPGLTFLMGENGIGKSSILHALACSFRPENKTISKDYRWPNFFMTYGDQNWVGTEIEIVFTDNTSQTVSRPASEKRPRWRPNYDRRKKKDVSYLGILDRVPHVESEKYTNKYAYTNGIKLSDEVVSDCSFILGKDFKELSYATVDKAATHVQILCVKLSGGLSYTSATMGAGEQAVIKIIETVRSASKGSLIVIDEPEALLHHLVIKRMLQILDRLSNEKKLQILCSSHWPGLIDQKNVQIYSIGRNAASSSLVMIEGPDKKVLQQLLPDTPKKLLWCEDSVAAAILKVAIRSNGYQSKFKVVQFGSSYNSFSIASHLALSGSQDELVILDGDEDADLNTVDSKLKKVLSGTEANIEALRGQASSYFAALNPRGAEMPEGFLLNAAKKNLRDLSGQLQEEMTVFHPPADIKTGFYHLAERLEQTPEELAGQISVEIQNSNEFKIYTSEVIQKCRSLLLEPPILADFHRCINH
jgi:predicted ATPase